jgi:cobalt-precorrin 5A hydrolase
MVGFGCRQGCPTERLAALLDKALADQGWRRDEVFALASIAAKAAEPGLLALAAELGCELRVFSTVQLATQAEGLTHRSARVFALTGCHGVAESAALFLATQLGQGPALLRVARQANAWATLAIAQAA